MKKNLAMLTALITMGTSGIYAQPGALDPSFDGDGKVITVFPSCVGRGVAIQADGKIVVAGNTPLGLGGNDYAFARYNPDGSLDATFGSGGTIAHDALFGGDDMALEVAIQADGKIVAVGTMVGVWAGIMRLNPDGSLDGTFGVGGINFVDADNNPASGDYFRAVVIQPDGKIVAAGGSLDASGNNGFVMRFNPDGTSDMSFDGDGYAVTNFLPSYLGVGYDGVALQADGKIVVSGSGFNGTNSKCAFARYNTDGSLDTSFDTDGKVEMSIGGGAEALYRVSVAASGKIVAAGNAIGLSGTVDGAVVSLNADGSPDMSFGTAGVAFLHTGGGVSDYFRSSLLQPDGKIVAAGPVDDGSDIDFLVACFNADGTLDTNFDGDGFNVIEMGGFDLAFDVALQADGKIVASGTGTDLSLVRLFPSVGGGNAPEINVQGNSMDIMSGDMSPAFADGTRLMVCTGTNTTSHPFTIQNTGSSNLMVNTITSSNPNFTISGMFTLPATIPAGGSIVMYVSYTPVNNNTATSTITIGNDDANEGTYTFGVQGNMNTAIYNTFAVTKPSCYGGCNGSINLSATGGAGGFTYMWSQNVGGQTTATVTGLCQGVYHATITDAAGCMTVRSYMNVANPSQLMVSTTSAGANCQSADGMASAGVTGGATPYMYAWSNGGSTSMITGLQAGTYTVTVTDANGCSAVKSAYVGSSCFTAIATPTHINTCTNTCTGSAMAQATGGVQPYSFVWSNGATTQTVSGLCKATYTVTATDANGATATASVSINFTPLSVATTTTAATCNGVCDGTATAVPSGAQAPYTYQWNTNANSQTTQTASGLCYGAYRVTVTSANGCSVVKQFINVSQPPAISLTTGSSPASCQMDGIAYVSPSNGVAPYMYAWSNGGNTNTITGLQAGTYTVTVTDANGCMKSKSVTVANACGAKPTEDTDLNADIALMEEEATNADVVELSNDINETLRLNDFSAVDVFNVFPNPNNGQFTIDIQLAAETDARIRIQDALGRTLYENSVQGQFFQVPIDANQWTAGAYFVQLISAQGQTTRKVVITK